MHGQTHVQPPSGFFVHYNYLNFAGFPNHLPPLSTMYGQSKITKGVVLANLGGKALMAIEQIDTTTQKMLMIIIYKINFDEMYRKV